MRAATPCGPTPLVAILVSSSQRGGKVYDLLKGTFKANMLVKAYESHSKGKTLISQTYSYYPLRAGVAYLKAHMTSGQADDTYRQAHMS